MRDRWNENKDYNIDVGVVNQILWLRDRDYGILVWMKMSKTKNQTATKKRRICWPEDPLEWV